jgi:ketosteroid isomerase-like protein
MVATRLFLIAWLSIGLMEVPGQSPVGRGLDLRAIVETERSFARAASEKGIRDSFLDFLAEDSVLFRPQPVPGRKWMLEHPPAAGLLRWRPVFAEVSAAGDLGYTTGPYEFYKQPGDAVAASCGNYFTIWKKQSNGKWKALIDFGISNPTPPKSVPDFDADHARVTPALKAFPDALQMSGKLIDRDARLARTTQTSGVTAMRPAIAGDARFLHEGRQPALGIKAILAMLAAEPGTRSWEPSTSGSSASGDLGYTYGSFRLQVGGAEPKSGYYLRVWKRQTSGDWLIVIEVINY